ncbi:hypothetical protein EON73_00625 [bacterium]|nr:MAG: hypothetical protein EON73_00625 [bacterium]
MPYLTLSEAAIITGKSEKTIRRLCAEIESKQFISREDGKILIDSNYLSQKYSMKITGQNEKKVVGQNRDKKENVQLGKVDIGNVIEIENFQHKIILLEQEVRLKDMLMNEKDQRIEDLQQSLRLLGSSISNEKVEPLAETISKKKWWQF